MNNNRDALPLYRSRRGAAEYLTERGYPTSPRCLDKLACLGGGPIYRLYNRRALYRDEDLLTWAESRTSQPRRHATEGRMKDEAA